MCEYSKDLLKQHLILDLWKQHLVFNETRTQLLVGVDILSKMYNSSFMQDDIMERKRIESAIHKTNTILKEVRKQLKLINDSLIEEVPEPSLN